MRGIGKGCVSLEAKRADEEPTKLTIDCFPFGSSEERMQSHDRDEGEDDEHDAESEERSDDVVGEGFDLELSDLNEDLRKTETSQRRVLKGQVKNGRTRSRARLNMLGGRNRRVDQRMCIQTAKTEGRKNQSSASRRVEEQAERRDSRRPNDQSSQTKRTGGSEKVSPLFIGEMR